MFLALFRITRRWNQTGQKYSGSSDIARTFLPAHNLVLWFLVIATFLELSWRMTRRALWTASHKVSLLIAIAPCLTILAFKFAYITADAPELIPRSLKAFSKLAAGTSLVTQARTAFLSIGICSICMSYQMYYRKRSSELTGIGTSTTLRIPVSLAKDVLH